MRPFIVSHARIQPNSQHAAYVGAWGLQQRPAGNLPDVSGKGKVGTLNGKPIAGQSIMGAFLQFDGINDYVDSGNVGTVNSVAFWMDPDTTTEDIADFDGGTHTIEITAGTLSATGFDTPSLYVNDAAGSTVVADAPQFIGVSTATGFSATALLWGLLTGKIIGFFAVSEDEEDATWFAEQYALGKRALWKTNPVPNTIATVVGSAAGPYIGDSPFRAPSGQWDVVHDTVETENAKVIECISAGNLLFPQALLGEVAEDDNWRGWIDTGAGYVEGAISTSSRILAMATGDKISLGTLAGNYSVIKDLLP